MTRMTNASDTLATARRLETDFGMDRRAAEGVATAINERFTGNVATKADIRELATETKADVQRVENQITSLATETKADVQRLESQITSLATETKADVQRVENQIATLATETKADIRGLDTKIDMLKYTIGFGIAVLGLVLAALQIYGLVR